LSNLGAAGDIGAVPMPQRGRNTLQTSKIVSSFSEKCPGFTVTSKKERADYVLVMEEDDKSTKSYVIFDKEGDTLGSGSTMLLGTAMKEICNVLGKAQDSLAGKTQNQ
jgi:hypothetical protein